MTDLGTPAEKLAALNERLKGTELLTLLNIKQKPAPDVLVQRVAALREVVFGLCAHLQADDPVRATALEQLKRVEALLQDPVEWHILTRAQELRKDPSDPQLRATLEAAFYEEHVPRTVWQSVPPEGSQADLRKSLRLPMLLDVELELPGLGGGKKVRCQMQNLSRDGVCLEVPAGFAATQVSTQLQLSASAAPIAVAGDVVWRDAASGRVGVQFKIGVNEQNALDAALQAHFASLQRAVDRWLAVAPRSPGAIACAAIVGYAAAALPSGRKEHVDKLTAAAQADPTAKELQLALAKLRMEECDYDGAAQALRRVVVADRADPRFRLLELTLAQRSGKGAGGARLRVQRALEAARVPLVALAGVGLAAAVTFAVASLRGPFDEVNVVVGGLPCQRLEIAQATAQCTVDAAAFQALPPTERAALAEKTLQGLVAKKIAFVMVVSPEGMLDVYDEATIAALKQAK